MSRGKTRAIVTVLGSEWKFYLNEFSKCLVSWITGNWVSEPDRKAPKMPRIFSHPFIPF